MSIKNFLLFLFAFTFLIKANSAECLYWLHHLEKEHKVSVVPKTQVINSSFKYYEIPNTDLRVAIPKEYESKWKIEIRSSESGSSFSAYNTDFGYAGEFDKNGKCVNSTGFMYDNMDRVLPKSLDQKKLKFNYDWAACEKVKDVDIKFSKIFKKQNADDSVKLLQKFSPQDLSILDNESKRAGSNPIYKVQPSSVSVLIETCRRQNDYLQFTNEPQNILSEPNAIN